MQSKYAGNRIVRGLTAVARAGALWRRMARAEKLHFRQTGRIFAAGNPPQGDMSENLTIFLLQPALRPVLLAHANSKGYFRPPEINPAARKRSRSIAAGTVGFSRVESPIPKFPVCCFGPLPADLSFGFGLAVGLSLLPVATSKERMCRYSLSGRPRHRPPFPCGWGSGTDGNCNAAIHLSLLYICSSFIRANRNILYSRQSGTSIL